MRNLVEYPVTCGEACGVLQEAQKVFYDKYKDNMGNIDGLALFYAEQFIKQNKSAFEQFTKTLPKRT